MEERPVGSPAVGVCQRRCHQPAASAARHRRYSFLPADVIGDEFGKREQVAAAGGDTPVHFAVQGHSRSPILEPIKSPYMTSY